MAHDASHSTTARRARLALAGLAATSLVACIYDDDYYDHYYTGGTFYTNEVEPNDEAGQANYIGYLEPGETFVIDGSVAGVDGFGPDGIDGFEFTSPGGTHVSFYLDGVDPASDLDICLYDPYFGDYVACWDSPSSDESGEFWIDGWGTDYQLVVIAANAATAYTLTVDADGYYYSTTGLEDGTKDAAAPDLRAAEEFAPDAGDGKLEGALEAFRAAPRGLEALEVDATEPDAPLRIDLEHVLGGDAE